MIHVFNFPGPWKDELGFEYTIKAVHQHQVNRYLSEGWYRSLEEAKGVYEVKAKKAKAAKKKQKKAEEAKAEEAKAEEAKAEEAKAEEAKAEE